MTRPRRVNMLVMDGGGVRGLSTLIILQHLISQINTALHAHGYRGGLVGPRDIFQFAGGTSTGGLIALMLAVLELSVDDCIREYRDLSATVFRKKKLRGKYTGGLWTSRYSGTTLYETVRSLPQRHGRDPDEMLLRAEEDPHGGRMECVVVCREEAHEHNRTPYFKDLPVFLCSIDCGNTVHCKVCEAARATSAAMSYFKAMVVNGRFFSDGGFAHNNPSPKIYEHYTKPKEVLEARRYNNGLEDFNRLSIDATPVATHGQLNFSHCRLVNIGTGSYFEGVTPKRNRDTWALLPKFRRRLMFYKESLITYATSSEAAAKEMRSQVRIRKDAAGGNALEYNRLSASNGLCWIKLDRYQELDQIERLTREWLSQTDTTEYIIQLAL